MAFRIDWSDEARADVRLLDKPTAMRVFEGLLRFARTGEGDVKQSKELLPEGYACVWANIGCSFPCPPRLFESILLSTVQWHIADYGSGEDATT